MYSFKKWLCENAGYCEDPEHIWYDEPMCIKYRLQQATKKQQGWNSTEIDGQQFQTFDMNKLLKPKGYQDTQVVSNAPQKEPGETMGPEEPASSTPSNGSSTRVLNNPTFAGKATIVQDDDALEKKLAQQMKALEDQFATLKQQFDQLRQRGQVRPAT